MRRFVQELADHSVKSLIPSALSKEELRQLLDEAEKAFVMVREIKDDLSRQIILFDMGVEDLASALLYGFGHLPSRASQGSFEKLLELLSLLAKLQSNQHMHEFSHLKQVAESLHDVLIRQEVPLSAFRQVCYDLKSARKKKHMRHGCSLARRLLRTSRIILDPDPSLDRLHAYEFPAKPVSEYLQTVVKALKNAGLESSFNEEGEYADVPVDFEYHQILDFGRKLRMRCCFCRDDTEQLPVDWLRHSIADLEAQTDVIPFLIIDLGLSQENLDNLRTVSGKYGRPICVVDREQLERQLRRIPRGLSKLVITQADLLIPAARGWRGHIFPGEKLTIPKNIFLYERDVIRNLYGLVRQEMGSAACMQASKLLETTTRELALLVIALLEQGLVKGNHAACVNQLTRDRGWREYINAFFELHRLCSRNKDLRRSLV